MRRGEAGRGEARLGKVRLGTVWLGKGTNGSCGAEGNQISVEAARQGMAWPGWAGHGPERQGSQWLITTGITVILVEHGKGVDDASGV